jgi:hypothetical protein
MKMKTRKHRNRKQKLYKMKGCSKRHYKSRSRSGGGSSYGDVYLAYTGKPSQPGINPFLAYTGKGGDNSSYAYPNTGPPSKGITTIFNNASLQKGGCCGSCPLMRGGSCNTCSLVGGTKNRHRYGCKCSDCKTQYQKGGGPYPNGLVGQPYTPKLNDLPGVDGIPGNHNYYPLNEYKVDPQTSMIDLGANKPFLGGKRRNKSKRQRGGTITNFLGQDLINLGRQFQFGVGSAYNALAGYKSPVNPLPFKDQLHTKNDLRIV